VLSLREAIRRLRRHYGPPVPPPTTDPFALVLWENIAYLATPARRREAFAQLAATIGTTPPALLTADSQLLESVTAHGVLKKTSAAKLRECARIALLEFGGDLNTAIGQPLNLAKRSLRSFPAIGEPGAEKILLFAGRHALLAPDSNGLRVLVRLGLIREEKSYARTYANAREAVRELPAKIQVMQEAHLLLQQHGQTLCRRNLPLCDQCPLRHGCASIQSQER
jgi:endonuclease III